MTVASGCGEVQSIEEIITMEQPENNDNSMINDVYSELSENTIYYSGKPIYRFSIKRSRKHLWGSMGKYRMY